MVKSLVRRLLSRSSLSRCLLTNPTVERYNAVKPVNDYKVKTLVGIIECPHKKDSPSQQRDINKGERTAVQQLAFIC